MHLRRSVGDVLAKTIKSLESQYEPVLNPNLPFIIRLDGVSFRKYTASMQKPFDPQFTKAMISTTFGLLEGTFAARTAFVQPDEITLAFSGDPENKQLLMYNGRIQKITSIIASHASLLFNSFMKGNESAAAVFDARTFSCPDEKTAMQAIYWRHAFDCRRNAINTIARYKLAGRDLKNVGQSGIIKLLDAQNISLNSFDLFQNL
jgi:tRNA(His) guanylyltransferase